MKNAIFLVIILLTLCSFAQRPDQKIQNLESRIDSVKIQLDSIKLDETSLYNLKKDILYDKLDYQKIEKEVFNAHKDWLSYLANFWAIVGLLLGTVVVFFSFKERINKAVDNAVDNKVIESISNITNIKSETIKRLYTSEQENIIIRDKTRVLIINEKNTGINESLAKIFIRGSEKSKFNSSQLGIENFNEVNNFENINLVVIDNNKYNLKKWIFTDRNKKVITLTPYGKDLFILVSKLLNKNIAVLYFSEDEQFPTASDEFNNLPNKYLLAYSNAHSNIYSNAMNLLKLQDLYAN